MKAIKIISQWTLVAVLIGILVGSISAFFLVSLDWVTQTRESNMLWVYLIPLGGLFIGYGYYFTEKGVEGGNNRLIKEMIVPERKIHWKMTPLILFGTLATHLFGGSAGREGTAVQMGGATADQLSSWFNWGEKERSVVLRMGVAAGFASIFGTPLAGILFAYELSRDKSINYWGILPVLAASFFGDFICHWWQVEHTIYTISSFPEFNLSSLLWTSLAGIIFGIVALTFNYTKKSLTQQVNRYIPTASLRPFIGGVGLLAIVLLTDSTRYLGLGVPVIQDAFLIEVENYDFIVKLLFTAFTLAVGFKGGEATPLFFIGATLGNALVWFMPLPMSFLAGLGFIAVFAGATNTPLACLIMGVELFGLEGLPYYAIVCLIAFLISGKTSVYAEQQKILRKYSWIQRKKN